MTAAPTRLRCRRFVDEALLDEEVLPISDITSLGERHGEWSGLCTAAGIDWRVDIHDPDSEVLLITMHDALMRDPSIFALRMAEGLQRLYDHYHQEGTS